MIHFYNISPSPFSSFFFLQFSFLYLFLILSHFIDYFLAVIFESVGSMSAVLRVHVSGFTCPVTIGVMLMLIRLKIIVRPAEKGALGPCNLVKREAWRREIETRENRRAISMGKEPIIS